MKFYEGGKSLRAGVCFMLVALVGTMGCSEEKGPESTEPLHVAQSAMMASGKTQREERVSEKFGPILETDESEFFETREAPTPFLMDINWDEANAYERIESHRIPKQVVMEVENLPLPVLIPGTADFLDNAFAVTDENWYTITADYDDHTVVVQSSRVGFEYNGPEGREVEERIVKFDFQVSRASMIASVVFPAFGLVYSVEVICLAPDVDPRCTEDDYVLSLANAMSIAGGAQ